VKISKGLLESLDNLGDHHPLKVTHFIQEMPSLEVLRTLIPNIIKDDEIEFIYSKQDRWDFWFPKHRIAFMLFINHFFRIRTDPRFLIAEAVACHRITGTKHKARRHAELLQMAKEAQQHGCESLAPGAYAFLEWWAKGKRRKNLPMFDHLGRRTVFRKSHLQWGTHLNGEVFSCKSSAERYARDHFRLRYEALLEEE